MLSSALASRVHLDRARTSKAVSALIRKGLVTRTARVSDRRKMEVALAAPGHRIYESLFPIVVQLNRDLLDVLTGPEIEQLDDCLGRIQARADELIRHAVLPKADRGHRN
jgi:DNA-binding MarR family transcriptional regulator